MNQVKKKQKKQDLNSADEKSGAFWYFIIRCGIWLVDTFNVFIFANQSQLKHLCYSIRS